MLDLRKPNGRVFLGPEGVPKIDQRQFAGDEHSAPPSGCAAGRLAKRTRVAAVPPTGAAICH